LTHAQTYGSVGAGKVKGVAVTVVNASELRNSFSIALACVGELTGLKAVEYVLVVWKELALVNNLTVPVKAMIDQLR
jgi:hypothetical protein